MPEGPAVVPEIPKPLPKKEPELMSPKKQIALGIEPAAVKCRHGLYLVLKFSDETPVCVKESTVEILYERGWGGTPPPCCKK